MTSAIFRPVTLGALTAPTRLWLAPMCQYQAPDARPVRWHHVHYGTRALGVGVAIVEATAVSPEARITPYDLGIWSEDVLGPFTELASTISEMGAVPAIQLSHGGRKSSRTRPWEGDRALLERDGGWRLIGPSAIRFGAEYEVPDEMSIEEIHLVQKQFAYSASLSARAGFRLIELHGGHGRLLHSFFSPISNRRSDEYGKTLEGCARFVVETAQKVREALPEDCVLAVRLSCVDWLEQGIQIEDSVRLAHMLKEVGVSLIDCTSGGICRPIPKKISPGYQVPFAREIRNRVGIATAAVGAIHSIREAAAVLDDGAADVVLMGRRLLADPQIGLLAGFREFGAASVPGPYAQAFANLYPSDGEHIPEL